MSDRAAATMPRYATMMDRCATIWRICCAGVARTSHSSGRWPMCRPISAARSRRARPSSLWQQLEHLRIAQWDILEFSRNPAHVSPEWPAGYWPESALPWSEKADQRAMPGHCFSWSSLSRSDCADSPGAWQRSIDAFLADRTAMIALVANPAADLYRPFPHGTGQTLLREALVVADHNAYHIGQIVLLRRLLGCW